MMMMMMMMMMRVLTDDDGDEDDDDGLSVVSCLLLTLKSCPFNPHVCMYGLSNVKVFLCQGVT